jgi:hypothetical protein
MIQNVAENGETAQHLSRISSYRQTHYGGKEQLMRAKSLMSKGAIELFWLPFTHLLVGRNLFIE